MDLGCTAISVLVLSTQARSRLLRHASSQDLCLRDSPAAAAPAKDHLASSSEQLDRRAARGIWTAGEPIVNLLTVERASWSRTGPARSARPDWPAAAPPRRRPADLLPASRELLATSFPTNSAVYRQSFSSAIPAHSNHFLPPSLCPRASSPRQNHLACLALRATPTFLLRSSTPYCETTSYSFHPNKRPHQSY